MRKLIIAATLLVGVGLVFFFLGRGENPEGSPSASPEHAADPKQAKAPSARAGTVALGGAHPHRATAASCLHGSGRRLRPTSLPGQQRPVLPLLRLEEGSVNEHSRMPNNDSDGVLSPA